ncbi:PAS domain-containing protein (plasmid) [Hymenobacter tibetensis]|uniref:histidine kinase n=1 Tax=Hymenobacter tibetensis TaxID=497967 RepID=A0ABY4D5B6_9BACT|nr:PAS domain-containing protein [Hymenobacter tibetensis]UOG77645.1 PAS domain-containing protein [Hymenobacter tibetensis]
MESPADAHPEQFPPPTQPTAEQLLAALPWGLLMLNEHQVIQRINQQAAQWCGVPPEALLGQALAEADLPAAVRDTLLSLLKPDEAATREIFLPRQKQWIALWATPISPGWMLYGQDITAQKQREQQYQALAENTPDVLTRWGPDLRLRYANSAFAAKAGQPLDALLGRTFAEMDVPADITGPYLAALQRVFDTSQPQEHYNPFPTPHGEVQYYSRLVPELRDGRVETVLGIARDITALQQSEAATRQLQSELARQATDQYQTLFHAMDQGFCVVEVVFDETSWQAIDFRYRELNPAFVHQSGLPADTLGRSIRELLPDLDPFWFTTYGAVARSGEPQRFEHHVPQVSRWFDVHAFRVGAPEARQVGVLFHDITARKQQQQQQAFLLGFSDALRAETSAPHVAYRALGLLCAQLQLDRCYIGIYDLAQDRGIFPQQVGNHRIPPLPAEVRLSDFPDALRVAYDRTLVIDDLTHTEGLSDTDRQNLGALGMRALVAATLRRGADEPQWAIVALSADVRPWTPGEVALLEAATERTWAALERARAEEALRQSGEEFRLLVTTTSDTVYRLSADCTQLEQLLGKDFLADTLSPSRTWTTQYIPDEDLPRVQAAIADAIGRKGPLALEHRVRQADGTVGWAHTRAVPVLDAQGEVTSWLGAATNITARKQAEEALRESEERFRAVANLVPDLLWRSTPDSDTTWYNQRWYEYTGQTPAEAARYGWTDVIHPDDRAASSHRYHTAVVSGQPLGQEHRIRSAQGEYRWFQVQARPLLSEHGTVRAWYGAATDIHARKLAEEDVRHTEERHRAELEQQVAARTQELQQSRDLLHGIAESQSASISAFKAVRDAHGHVVDLEYIFINTLTQQIAGGRELVGRRYLEEFPEAETAGFLTSFRRVIETGVGEDRELPYHDDQLTVWFRSNATKLDDGVLVVGEDITPRKQAEQERLKTLRLLEQAEAVAGLGSWDYDLLSQEFRWSDGMYRLFGLPLGQPVQPAIYLHYVVDEDRTRAEDLVHRMQTGNGTFEETLRLRVGEQVKTVRVKAVVLRDEAGQPVRVLGVDLDISELQRLEADNLRLRLSQQQALFEAVQAAQETERKRMAESLHNGIGQILFATKLRLDQLHAPVLYTLPTLVAARNEADQLLSEAIRQTRALSHELVPLTLERFGLRAALQDIGRTMSTPQLRLRCHVLLDEDAAPLSLPLQLALYRMAQELALNINKHAQGATEANLELETMPGWVLLRAEDNGPGFGAKNTAAGLGLRSMRDRVVLLGGQLETGAVPAGGAYVRIRIPLPTSATL